MESDQLLSTLPITSNVATVFGSKESLVFGLRGEKAQAVVRCPGSVLGASHAWRSQGSGHAVSPISPRPAHL